MDKEPRGGFVSDDGMSIAEVVIAAFILFFVLTAVMGLVWTTTQMGVSAKERSAITNALTSHMEWVRSLNYDEVALQGVTPSGTIPAQRTLTVDGFTIVMTTSVTEGGPGVKEVQVDAVASGLGYPTLEMSQHASIRDYNAALTSTATNTGPRIRFGSVTPPQDTVVYSGFYGSNSYLYIDAFVEIPSSSPGVTITKLEFKCGDVFLRNGITTNALSATWDEADLGPGATSVSRQFRWNTQQVKSVETSSGDTVYVPAIEDGWRLVRIMATDSEGNTTLVERQFYVDNNDPGPPGNPVAQVISDTEARLGWTSAKDGTHDAWEYGVKIEKIGSVGEHVLLNNVDASGIPVDFKLAPSAFIHSSTNPPAGPATAFSRYLAWVRAYSPRLLTSAYVELLPQGYAAGGPKTYVTRPLLSGESYTLYTGKPQNGTYSAVTSVSGSVTTPTFGCDTITYDLYRGLATSSMSLYKANTTPTFTDTIPKFLGRATAPPTYYYQYKITYRPMGDTAVESDEVILSNIIGPTNTTSVSAPMPQVAW